MCTFDGVVWAAGGSGMLYWLFCGSLLDDDYFTCNPGPVAIACICFIEVTGRLGLARRHNAL